MIDLIELWPLWLPIIVALIMHAFEKSKTGVGCIYAQDLPPIMRRRLQIYSFQTKESFQERRVKGSVHIDITEIDPDAFLLMLEKKYPVLCYCDDGVQSKRYFQHISEYQKAYWLAGGLDGNQSQMKNYITGEDYV
ncbi:rhodanese-like domain-containing protein [Gammaproteobacteria bacterium]|nr:rhodanese-like domain-containing protein [Gammaproteobacteria bacterium]